MCLQPAKLTDMKVSDIELGKTYHNIKILEYVERKGSIYYYKAKCLKCGKEYLIDHHRIGKSKMCRDCFRKSGNRLNLIGHRFGNLMVTSFIGKRDGKYIWECKCDCGNVHTASTGSLRSGNVKSCGCACVENARQALRYKRTAASPNFEYKGTLSKHPLYHSWWGMKCRCENPNDPKFGDYGGRGITVCERWSGLYGFEHFVHDMGPKPTPKHTIDRIDVNGNYEPSNCRWATPKEQQNNLRCNLCFYMKGERITCPQLSEIVGISTCNISRKANLGVDINFIILNSNKFRKGKRGYYKGHINHNRIVSDEVIALLETKQTNQNN